MHCHSHRLPEENGQAILVDTDGAEGEPQAPDGHGEHDAQDRGTDTEATRHRHAVGGLRGGQRPALPMDW